jgi:hypothetical protein
MGVIGTFAKARRTTKENLGSLKKTGLLKQE